MSEVAALLRELGVTPAQLRRRGLKRYPEARLLTPVGLGTDGRDKLLQPTAARAWLAMRDAAAGDGVTLLLISAFRSADYQMRLLRDKLGRGMTLDEVLRINAPPGYSEHHTGRAVDIGVAGVGALEPAFDTTPAFAWLRDRASRHGFAMSYPKGNAQGYLYEPWHWCWQRPRG